MFRGKTDLRLWSADPDIPILAPKPSSLRDSAMEQNYN